MVVTVETMLFALGPEGLVLSAGIGLTFALFQSTNIVKYNDSVRDTMKKAVTEGLKNQAVTKAANDVKDFQGDLETMRLFTSDIKEDDFGALDVSRT